MSSKNRTIYRKTTHRMVKRKLRIPYSRSRNQKMLASAFLIFFLVLPYVALHYRHAPTSQTLDLSNEFYSAAETPTLSLTYYSRFNNTHTPVESSSKLSGDHVILNATWSPADNVNGTLIQVNAPAIPNVITAEGENNTVEIDTRALGNNATCTVNVTTQLLNGTVLKEFYTDVIIGNFFTPHIEVLTPNGGEAWPQQHNITWFAWDNNTDDVLSFEILLSADDGTTFQLLASEIETQWFVWDFSGFMNHSSYIIEVRVSDGIYTASDQSDTSFIAGGVPSSSTSATSTCDWHSLFQLQLSLVHFCR
ncbi:MAG: hypothetical protein ACW98Y_03355 [Candidatus Thorarchaeota archaeon]